jgi:catechol 2,3-dioxygenase-like lactoylglutathione lyase family enzyme
MITGSHCVLYTKKPKADRDFFRDVLGIAHVDAGEGYLVFALPPSEMSVHAGEKNNVHEFYLICDDAKAFVKRMKKHNVRCTPLQPTGWGLLTHVTLPGGGKMGVYEARYPRPMARRKKSASSKR